MLRQVDDYGIETRDKDNAQRVCKGNLCTNWTHPKFFIDLPFASKRDFKNKIDKIIKRFGNPID